jgi:3-deoxy-D-manno-octulosonic-acid transferase
VFFKWWGGFYRKVLHCFTHLFVQNEESKNLLASVCVTDVTVVGDTRFDRVVKIAEQAHLLPLVATFVEDGKKIFIAGSSWGPDEAVYMSYFNTHPGWKLIVASHEVNEERIKNIEEQLRGYCVRYTQATMEEVRTAKCLIIDCFGLLSSIYRYGNVAYVGGGFGVGIHNVLEAAVYGIPVFFGPNNYKFQEAQQLKACGGGIEITSENDFDKKMSQIDNDAEYAKKAGEAAGAYVSQNAGASARIFKVLGL